MARFLGLILIAALAWTGCDKSSSVSYVAPNGESYTPGTGGGSSAGVSAGSFLRDNPYRSLVIEIDYMPGFAPDSRSVSLFEEILEARLNKPGGITIIQKQINPTLKEVFNLADIADIESRNRTAFTGGSQLSAYILFVSGRYYSGNVLGLTYSNTAICYFGEALNYFSVGLTDEDHVKGMALLMLHEFGHLMGLVNCGSPMVVNHEDPGDRNHCTNPGCIMHHSVESGSFPTGRQLLDNPAYDGNCINDLRANGGK